MSGELRGVTVTGKTLYAQILNKTAQHYNGTTFETYAAGNWGNYDISLPEQGSSGVYVGDFPTAIVTSGTYDYLVFRQVGASPAEGDPVINTGKIDWTGSTSASAATGAMSGSDWADYVRRCGFKRTDKDTELYEATTDAIQEMRRRFMFDEAEAEATTTDTISVLGDFKLDYESDFGLILGIVLEDDDTGTPLNKISKDKFDQLYSSINVESDRGYPEHYCLYAGSIYIGPIPDSTSYSYRISYSKRAGTVTSATTGVPFTNYYRDILADNVQARLYKGLDEPQKAAEYRAAFEEGFFYAQRRETINTGSHCFNVTPFGC